MVDVFLDIDTDLQDFYWKLTQKYNKYDDEKSDYKKYIINTGLYGEDDCRDATFLYNGLDDYELYTNIDVYNFLKEKHVKNLPNINWHDEDMLYTYEMEQDLLDILQKFCDYLNNSKNDGRYAKDMVDWSKDTKIKNMYFLEQYYQQNSNYGHRLNNEWTANYIYKGMNDKDLDTIADIYQFLVDKDLLNSIKKIPKLTNPNDNQYFSKYGFDLIATFEKYLSDDEQKVDGCKEDNDDNYDEFDAVIYNHKRYYMIEHNDDVIDFNGEDAISQLAIRNGQEYSVYFVIDNQASPNNYNFDLSVCSITDWEIAQYAEKID